MHAIEPLLCSALAVMNRWTTAAGPLPGPTAAQPASASTHATATAHSAARGPTGT